MLPWEEMISPDEYVSVLSTVDTQTINDSRFASRRVKDAIVDRILDRQGRRPNSGPDRDNVVINLHWRGSDCRIYINTTGRKLADRNYRKIPLKAPMQEILAAAVIMETGYDGSRPLVNPMCGSGTLAIEAALLASGRPPGLLRTNFAFQHLLGFDSQAFQAIRAEARKIRHARTPAPIIASDIDDRAIEAARQNAMTAGVDQLIRFEVCDFAATPLPAEPGILVLNPEYGERMGEEQALEDVYSRIGDFFKQQCPGWTGHLFTGNPNLAKRVGLRASRRVPFFNANIECRLLKYEMYLGSRKTNKTE
jgi:putative N6-adenine-specific DNA methylase